MLKSTYKPSAGVASSQQPLPAGWTEHTSPAGVLYYYNSNTKESTYKRPGAPDASAAPPSAFAPAVPQLQLSDPRVANAFMSQYAAPSGSSRGDSRGGRGGRGGRAGWEGRPRPQPTDKPRTKFAIPGCAPWILVYTKYGRRFAYNPDKNASFWRIPDKLQAGILELDQARIREKAGIKEEKDEDPKDQVKAEPADAADIRTEDADQMAFDDSEYEEVEVTDDEGDEEDGQGPAKRQRTEDPEEETGPVEFDEADIAFQLQAMGEDYGYDEEGEDEAMDEDMQEEPMEELTEEDARALFKDLLNDAGINPYSAWDKLLEEGKIMDDPRYTVLHTTKARKDAWEEWCRETIKLLREKKAGEEKADPRIAYLAFLQEKATPKLYWPEFKRKFKKEAPIKDSMPSDKEKEKLYRDHIARLKLPQSTLKTDLTALLRSTPLSKLNGSSVVSQLPPSILTDIRFISLDPKVRDPLIEGFIKTLAPAPEDLHAAESGEAESKAAEDRQRRERALQQRQKAAAEEKAKTERRIQQGKAMLRDEERELQRAMQVGKRGLHSQLTD